MKLKMINATARAKTIVDNTLRRAKAMEEDTQYSDRIKAYECIACFYSPRGSGQAMSKRHCIICGDVICSGCTDVNRVCEPCALTHKLCRHCGGDIDMRTRRRKWPSYAQEQKERN